MTWIIKTNNSFMNHSYSFVWLQLTIHWPNGRVYANGPGDLSSIPGRVISKIQKWYFMLPCIVNGAIQ